MDLTGLKSHLTAAESEINNLIAGKKVAATRARASLLNIQKETNKLRKEILEHVKGLTKKAAPVNNSVKDLPEPTPVKDLPEPTPVKDSEEPKKTKKKVKK